MKKIHFCIGEINDKLKANNNIAFILANEFSRRNIDITISYLGDNNTVETFCIGNVKYMVIPRGVFHRRIRNSKKLYSSKVLYALTHPLTVLLYLLTKKFEVEEYGSYIKKLKKYIDDETLYFIFVSPFQLANTYNRLIKSSNFVVYQLDPWAYNYTIEYPSKRIRQIQEKEVFRNTKAIFTTSAQYSEYKNCNMYNSILCKLHIINFPLVINRQNIDHLYRKDDRKIVYIGTINDLYRDPSKIIEYIIRIKEEYKIELSIEFYGEYQSEYLRHIIEEKSYIQHKGIIDKEYAYKIMNDNIILLNINNSIENQMPSKIIDYISTGNPIINVIKKENDETLKILENYENKFNFYENSINDDKQFVRFLLSNKKIPFSKIEDKYFDYTPEFVVDKILGVLSNTN